LILNQNKYTIKNLGSNLKKKKKGFESQSIEAYIEVKKRKKRNDE
jgi:hypothetical protein